MMIVTRQPACSVLSGGSTSAQALCLILLDRNTFAACLSMGPERIREDALRILAPFRLRRRGVETKLVLGNPTKSVDRTLLRNIANASPGSTESKQAKPMSRLPSNTPSQRTACARQSVMPSWPRHRPCHSRRPPARWADLELPLASSASRRLGETASARRNAVSLQRPLRGWARLAASCSPTRASTNQPQPGPNSLSWFPDSDSSLYWTVCGVIFVSSVKLRWMNSRFGQFEFRYSPSPQARSRR